MGKGVMVLPPQVGRHQPDSILLIVVQTDSHNTSFLDERE